MERVRSIVEELTNLARSSSLRDFLQETFITERGGRPVLAVKIGARSKVPGIVHDASGSGQTLFVFREIVLQTSLRIERTQRFQAAGKAFAGYMLEVAVQRESVRDVEVRKRIADLLQAHVAAFRDAQRAGQHVEAGHAHGDAHLDLTGNQRAPGKVGDVEHKIRDEVEASARSRSTLEQMRETIRLTGTLREQQISPDARAATPRPWSPRRRRRSRRAGQASARSDRPAVAPP